MPTPAGVRATASSERPGRPGRPRRYQADEERRLLLDAAFEVIRHAGYREATVADILAEAGLSSRSFYRHFASKDDLLHALVCRDVEQFAAAMTRRVQSAADPPAAVVAWLDEILGFGFDRPRARRAAILGAAVASSSLDPSGSEQALRLLVRPLAAALEAGAADGSLPRAELRRDAELVSSLAWETTRRLRELPTRAAKEQLRVDLLSFVGRALGADLP